MTDCQVKLTETISQHLLEKKFDILEYLPLDIVKSRHEHDKHAILAQIVTGYMTLHKSELLKNILTSQVTDFLLNIRFFQFLIFVLKLEILTSKMVFR